MAKAAHDALSRREREIMNALFASGNRATAEEIRARLADPPTGSSVRVMLARLEKKGYLRHSEDGLRYVYSATESPDKAKRTALQRYVQTFFGGSLAQMECPESSRGVGGTARSQDRVSAGAQAGAGHRQHRTAS